LPILEIPEIKEKFNHGDEIKVDISTFTVENITTNETFCAHKVPEFMRQMLLEGGLVEYYKKHKHLQWFQI
jgi:3-isopropylmalate/(R)-2-methylmalate dehydratase small subunit